VYITLSVILPAAGIFIAGRINLSMQFNKQVKQLYSYQEGFQPGTFRYRQLNGLPQPVQRYFRHVLKEGQQYVNSVKIRHIDLL